MNFIFHFFVFSLFLQIFTSSWRLYHLVVFIAKLWDDSLILVMVFLLLKLCKFRYPSFLKSSLVCEKRFFFSFLKAGLDATVLSPFLEKLMLVFVFLLIYLTIQYLEYIQDESRHTVRVQQVSHFGTNPDSLLASSSLKALHK